MKEPSVTQTKISLWRNSLLRRYLVLALLVAVLPLLVVTWLYDRFTGELLENLGEQKVQHSMNATRAALSGFLKARQFELETIVDLPDIERFVSGDPLSPELESTRALISFETDSFDIYGVLFFDAQWQLKTALPGVVSSGSPYWGEKQLSLAGLPRRNFADFVLIGPQAPLPGRSGWFLFAAPLPATSGETSSSGFVALHVRFASLTELLKSQARIDGFRPLLSTAEGHRFTVNGQPAMEQTPSWLSEEFAPGWSIEVIKHDPAVDLSQELRRPVFLLGVGASVVLVGGFFMTLILRLKRRFVPLIEGAEAVSRGDWNVHIPPDGNDEITLLARAFNRMGGRLKALIDSRLEVEKKAVLGEFSASIAHEVRNPLATIKVCVQSFPVDEDPRSKELITLVLEEIDRVNGVVENLLSFARPFDPERVWFTGGDLLRRLAALIEPLAVRENTNLFLSGDMDACLCVDENQIQQVLMNLALNSIQAMPEGGELRLDVQAFKQNTVITVSDTGSGMTPEALERATEPFYTTRTQGTGLGLSISKRLVQLNGGKLSINSEPGTGTRVSLIFNASKGTHG
ncbi:PAS domain-containing sensor histidine kinase [Marinobacter sp. 2_MG-2023]|uniref:sensor histidine kinase n=1 Tax=Marinobacter sp. 2_MG-2023 TaxID=3062679 RepID=UPI0026E1B6A9|nr:HAMP domain-containing sensor histidine kinase [Marinobacter sp. 2_MG-2023]MDO6442287.1 HAMP domain-containing sensor histidine kinase [Marinobacter sp. 2_MG-2023]